MKTIVEKFFNLNLLDEPGLGGKKSKFGSLANSLIWESFQFYRLEKSLLECHDSITKGSSNSTIKSTIHIPRETNTQQNKD